MTTYLKFPRPYCLFTIQLLWGYDDDQGQLVGKNFIQEHFGRKFLSQFFWSNSQLWGIFQEVDSNFKFSTLEKAHPCVRPHRLSHCA